MQMMNMPWMNMSMGGMGMGMGGGRHSRRGRHGFGDSMPSFGMGPWGMPSWNNMHWGMPWTMPQWGGMSQWNAPQWGMPEWGSGMRGCGWGNTQGPMTGFGGPGNSGNSFGRECDPESREGPCRRERRDRRHRSRSPNAECERRRDRRGEDREERPRDSSKNQGSWERMRHPAPPAPLGENSSEVRPPRTEERTETGASTPKPTN